MSSLTRRFPVVEKVVAHPELVEHLDYEATLNMTLDVLDLVLWPLVKRLIRQGWQREVADVRKSGDTLLTLDEVARRLGGITPQSVSRGWKAGRYPFMLKNGSRLVGSQEGLDRWIKARTAGR